MVLFSLLKAACAAFFFISFSYAQTTPKEADIDPAWKALLHYDQNNKSNVDGPEFFLSTEGKTNPKAELLANIEKLPDATKIGGHFKQPLYCVFPARVHYLKKNHLWKGKDKNEKLDCPDFLEWKKGIAGDTPTIYLSFSTSFPNNPASTFGHTFLRIQRGEGQNDLLDYTVAINAEVPPDTSDLFYAIKGLIGSFKTFIDINPFFQKIQEYNNSENRDLYEYKLNLSREEIDFLLEHIWEIYSSTWFDYYFLDENCSSFLAEILMAVKPINLLHRRFYYLPSDLVKLLIKNQVIDKNTMPLFRPGAKKKWKNQFFQLSSDEKKEYSLFSENKLDAQNVKVLDTVLLEYNIKQHRTKNNLEELDRTQYKKALLLRSKIKDAAKFPPISNANRPEISHSPSKIILSSAWWRAEDKPTLANSFKLKLGHHDELDNPQGFEPFSRFDFLGFAVTHFERTNKLKITEIKGVHIYSATPVTRTHRQLSWQVGGGLYPAFDSSCSSCLSGQGYAMGGEAFTFSSDDSRLLVPMIGAFISSGNSYQKGFRIGPIIEIANWGIYGPILIGLKASWYRDYYKEKSPFIKGKAEINWPFKLDHELRINSEYVTGKALDNWHNHHMQTALEYGFHY